MEPTCVDSCPAEEFEIRRISEIQSGGIARVCMGMVILLLLLLLYYS